MALFGGARGFPYNSGEREEMIKHLLSQPDFQNIDPNLRNIESRRAFARLMANWPYTMDTSYKIQEKNPALANLLRSHGYYPGRPTEPPAPRRRRPRSVRRSRSRSSARSRSSSLPNIAALFASPPPSPILAPTRPRRTRGTISDREMRSLGLKT